MGNSGAPRQHIQLPSSRCILYHDQNYRRLYQLQRIFHWQLITEYTGGRSDFVPAGGKGMGAADVAQIQGCCLGHVFDGRLVRDTRCKQNITRKLTNPV